jgi:type I restriction enzyme R subunit
MLTTIRPPFVPFDERKATRIYHRNLPHWRQNGVTYFVTFRLGDSIPLHVRQQWEAEKATWLMARGIVYDGENGSWRMSFERLPSDEQLRFHRHFNRQVQSCLDRGLGECQLRHPECIQCVRDELMKEDGGRYHMGNFVIMPNHVHLLVTPVSGEELEIVLKQLKGASAALCNRLLGRSGTFWQRDSYDHIVRSLEQLEQFRQYIADNPAKASIDILAIAHYRAQWMDEWFKLQ